MALFQLGDFTLHSGERSFWKIECDALTEADWQCLAHIGMCHLEEGFFMVLPVPMGGIPFARAMKQYEDTSGVTLLLVDDVLTTGNSLEETRQWAHKQHQIPLEAIKGLVVFSRGECPKWVTPIFQM